MRELGQLLSSAGAGRDVLSAGTDSNKAQKETGKHRTVATMTAGRAFKAALGRIVDAASIAASAGGLKWLLCIRPGHHQQVPGDFDLRYVAQQLTGLGESSLLPHLPGGFFRSRIQLVWFVCTVD
eukprot:SAG31_NODE_730_length_12505_cov_3.807109_10_plen_125_part_00